MHRAIRFPLCIVFIMGVQMLGAQEVTLLERAFAADSGAAGERDFVKAADLYRQAAAAGDAFASFQLGYMHEIGRGVPQDYTLARHYYEEAVARGLTDARVRLAICHLEGWGGPQDRAAFISELEVAASAGNIEAQKILGSAYSIGIGTARDLQRATHWLTAAARKDDAFAQLATGVLSEQARHRTVELNRETARTWYQLSAEQEYLAAMRAMARSLYEENHDAPQWAGIREWLELATEHGDAEAPFMLACLETSRFRNNPDSVRAQQWIALAAERGNFRAIEITELLDNGRAIGAAIRYVLNQPAEERYVSRTKSSAGDGPTRAPYVTKVVAPRYPSAARVAGIEGIVTLEFIVDTTGRVHEITAVADPHPLLTERAISAVNQWRFAPGSKDGRLVATRIRLDFPFSLEAETLPDMDAFLSSAYSIAESLGPAVLRDAQDLRPARLKSPLDLPQRAVGEPRRAAMLLLILDESGKPVRGHVLRAEPSTFGEIALSAALKARYVPRRENGKPVGANVALAYIDQEKAK